MTDAEVARWLWALGLIIDNERALTPPGYEVVIKLTPDHAFQLGGILTQAAETLDPSAEAEGPLPVELLPAAERNLWEMPAAHWARLYAACGSAEAVAQRIGCHPTTARNYLKRHQLLAGQPTRALAVWPGATEIAAAFGRGRRET